MNMLSERVQKSLHDSQQLLARLVWDSEPPTLAKLRDLRCLTSFSSLPLFLKNDLKKLVTDRSTGERRWHNTSVIWNDRHYVFRACIHDSDTAFVQSALIKSILISVLTLQGLGQAGPPLLDIWYVPVGGLKRLPAKHGSTITPEHVNSGMTWWKRGQPPRVLVYRAEDACKVTIHELIHAMGCDFMEDVRKSAEIVSVNESFVDAVACYIYAVWAFTLLKRGCRTKVSDEQHVMSSVDFVREHILNMAAQVSLHFEDGEWIETTSSRAYYLGKAALWFDLSAFLDTLGQIGETSSCVQVDAQGFLSRAMSCTRFRAEIDRRVAMCKNTSGANIHMVPSLVDVLGHVLRSMAPSGPTHTALAHRRRA